MFDVPLYDDDFLKLALRFTINVVVVWLVVACFNRYQKSRNYTFTFLMMNVMIFFICFTLKKLDLGLGIALGLFAIFAIIRFRTDAIGVKEMTYLFIVIGVAVINSLSNKKTSYAELAFTNAAIIALTYLLEHLLRPKEAKLLKQDLVYDNLDLISINNRPQLLTDIENRMGITPTRVKVSKIDLQKGAANISVYYKDPTLKDPTLKTDS
jgi:apolipoprotein N-acyltransferase